MGAQKPKAKGGDDAGLTASVAELLAEVRTFEALTKRIGRASLTSESQIDKTRGLLGQAEDSHRRFLERLREVVAGVEDARQRQNDSAEALSQAQIVLESRRREHEALRERQAQLGEQVRRLRAQLEEGGREETVLAAAREELGPIIELATRIVTEAREAGLVDLCQQGDAMQQQLRSLDKKLSGG